MGLFQDSLQDASGNTFVNLKDGSGNVLSSTSGSLNVNITGGGSSSAVADKTAFTYGTTVFQNVGAVFQDTSPTLTAGQSGAFRLNAQRGLHSNLRSSAGTELLGAQLTAVSIPVNIASDQVVPISATALPLPTGASTSALQTTGNTSLASLLALQTSATGTITSPAITAGSTTALASNAARKAFSFENNTLFPVYLAMAATASLTAFTVRVNPNALYEPNVRVTYTGIVTMISTGATGNLQVTEYT
jgi:hypothetical protein